MERSLGADFSSIEFRTDGSLGEPLGPLGKVHRSTVSLAPSLSPDSALGQAVIGHELAHVTQRTFDRGPSDHPARERDAIRRGTLAARGQPAGTGLGGSSPDEIEYFPPLASFMAFVIADAAADEVQKEAMERLEAEFQSAIQQKAEDVGAEVRRRIDEAQPGAVFLLEHAASHVQTYQTVKQALAVAGEFADNVADQLMERIIEKELEGENGQKVDKAELQMFLGLAKVAAQGSTQITEVYARHLFTQVVGPLINELNTVDKALEDAAAWILEKADMAENAADLAEGASALSSRLAAMKFAYKKWTGKDTLGDKVRAGAQQAREMATEVQEATNEVHSQLEKVQPFILDSGEDIEGRVTAKSMANMKNAAASAGLGALAQAKLAFYKAKEQGLPASEILAAAHKAGGKAFMIEMLGTAIAEGGRVFIFKGVIYLIPGAGAVAEVIADVGSTMFKVVTSVYGDVLQGHTEWALSNISELIKAGIGAAAEAGIDTMTATAQYVSDTGNQVVAAAGDAADWARQYTTDLMGWVIANPWDAACLGIKNTAAAVTEAPKYVTKAAQTGAKAAATGLLVGASSAYDGLSTGATAVYDGATGGATAVYDGVTGGATAVYDGVTGGVYDMYDGVVDSLETAKQIAATAWAVKGEVPGMLCDATIKMITTKAKEIATKGGEHASAVAFKAAKYALAGTPGVNYALLVAEAVAGFCVRHPDLAWFAYEYVTAVCEATGLTDIATGVVLALFTNEAKIDPSQRPDDDGDAAFTQASTSADSVPQEERKGWETATSTPFVGFPNFFLGQATPPFGVGSFAASLALQSCIVPPAISSLQRQVATIVDELDEELIVDDLPSTTNSVATVVDEGPRPEQVQELATELGSATASIVAALSQANSGDEIVPSPRPMHELSLPMFMMLSPMNRALLGYGSIGMSARFIHYDVTPIQPEK